MSTQLNLLYNGGGQVDLAKLVEFVKNSGGVVIIGDAQLALNNHTKPYSLDYWLRTNGAVNPDTKQATNEWIDTVLLPTGLFERTVALDVNTNRECKAIRLK